MASFDTLLLSFTDTEYVLKIPYEPSVCVLEGEYIGIFVITCATRTKENIFLSCDAVDTGQNFHTNFTGIGQGVVGFIPRNTIYAVCRNISYFKLQPGVYTSITFSLHDKGGGVMKPEKGQKVDIQVALQRSVSTQV